MIRKIFPILALIILSGCGLVNNVAMMGYTLSGIGPHRYRVTEEIEKSFPGNGLAIVSMDFKVRENADPNNRAKTIWRRLNEDGSYSDRMTFTYNEIIKRGRVRLAIKPGTYFIDGIAFSKIDENNPNYIIVFQNGLFQKFYLTDQYGWDFDKKRPIWFSFTVKAGQELYIPDIEILYYCEGGYTVCTDDQLTLAMRLKDETFKKDAGYVFGDLVSLERKVNKFLIPTKKLSDKDKKEDDLVGKVYIENPQSTKDKYKIPTIAK